MKVKDQLMKINLKKIITFINCTRIRLPSINFLIPSINFLKLRLFENSCTKDHFNNSFQISDLFKASPTKFLSVVEL